MEPSENKTISILVVMEGQKRELPFLQRLINLYGIDAKLYVFHTNIYELYRQMAKLDFAGDIRDVLVNAPTMADQDTDTLKNTKFAYTYLVFDCDAHHTLPQEKNMSIDDVVNKNMQRLKKMASYFVDETDPTIGKLYVNYPMMESYRDCDDFFEDAYQFTQVCLDSLKDYKSYTGTKKLAGIRIDALSKENFSALLRMNIFKLASIQTGIWSPSTYKEYLELSNQASLVSQEETLIRSTRYINVLNTTLFLLADYFGNQHGFYDSVMQSDSDQLIQHHPDTPA